MRTRSLRSLALTRALTSRRSSATPLKHHALAAHLLTLPRAWRCVFEEPPSVLPSLLVEGRARRFSSGDALSRLIRTLGRAQARPLQLLLWRVSLSARASLGVSLGRELTEEGDRDSGSDGDGGHGARQNERRCARLVDAADLSRVRSSLPLASPRADSCGVTQGAPRASESRARAARADDVQALAAREAAAQ